MSLMRKRATLAAIDANRANAQKSTGPTSMRGKSIVRNNARKWGRAERLRPLLALPGEDAGEFRHSWPICGARSPQQRAANTRGEPDGRMAPITCHSLRLEACRRNYFWRDVLYTVWR